MKQISIILICILFTSCSRNEKPKIIHTDSNESSMNTEDSTLIHTSDLPILLDSTNYLIHPIGKFEINKRNSKSYIKLSQYDSNNFNISNSSRNKIYGNLSNIKFQHKDSNRLKRLTDKAIKINSLTFLSKTYENIGKSYLIYEIIDNDSNKDKLLDNYDIQTLYISQINGDNFTKLIPNNQELLDWKVIHSLNRLYFKSIEDIDKNGKLNKKDKVHYYFMNLNDDALNVRAYAPI